jgi:hypothetical protein
MVEIVKLKCLRKNKNRPGTIATGEANRYGHFFQGT